MASFNRIRVDGICASDVHSPPVADNCNDTTADHYQGHGRGTIFMRESSEQGLSINGKRSEYVGEAETVIDNVKY